MKKINLIVAISELGAVIGNNGGMPDWNLLNDRKFFSKLTTGKKNEDGIGDVVITGRKNFESFPEKYRPLPGRTNIVITRDRSWDPKNPNVIVVYSMEEAIIKAQDAPGDTIWIIGGAEIYKLAFQELEIDEVYITYVDGEFAGTTFFPEWPIEEFTLPEIVLFVEKSDVDSHSFTIKHYKRS